VHTGIDELLEKYWHIPGGLVPLLQEVQKVHGYLSREILEKIASGMGISLAKVAGVATFYHQFHLTPRGRYIIKVCMGTACHVRGAAEVLFAMEDELGIKVGHTTPDLTFTLDQVACLGACGLAPVITINDETYGKLTPGQVPKLIEKYREEAAVVH